MSESSTTGLIAGGGTRFYERYLAILGGAHPQSTETAESDDPATDPDDASDLPAWSGAAAPQVRADMSAFGPTGADTVPDWLRASSTAADAYRVTNPLDRQIAMANDQLRSVSADSTRLLSHKQLLTTIAAAAQDAKHSGNESFDLGKLEITTATGEKISARKALEDAGLLELVNPTGDGKTSPNGIQSAIETLDASMSQITQNTQLRMIQLQDLMHQRDLFLQLATNQLASRQQIERRIAENIR